MGYGYYVKTKDRFIGDDLMNPIHDVPDGWDAKRAMDYLYGKPASEIMSEEELENLDEYFRDGYWEEKIYTNKLPASWKLQVSDFIRVEDDCDLAIRKALETI